MFTITHNLGLTTYNNTLLLLTYQNAQNQIHRKYQNIGEDVEPKEHPSTMDVKSKQSITLYDSWAVSPNVQQRPN